MVKRKKSQWKENVFSATRSFCSVYNNLQLSTQTIKIRDIQKSYLIN